MELGGKRDCSEMEVDMKEQGASEKARAGEVTQDSEANQTNVVGQPKQSYESQCS